MLHRISSELWFDVEKRYNTTFSFSGRQRPLLWFDVEKRYNTTFVTKSANCCGCGLM